MPERPTPEEFNKPIENSEAQELSPEVLEMVMEKVVDVGTPNLAIKSISTESENLFLVLKTGLVGSESDVSLSLQEPEKIRAEYKKKLSSRKAGPVESAVYFNIMGRSVAGVNIFSGDETINRLDQTRWTHNRKDSVGLIFDVDRFKEVAPTGARQVGDAKQVPFGSFCADDPGLVRMLIHKFADRGHKITVDEARKMLEPKSKYLASKDARVNNFATRGGLLRSGAEYGFFLNGRVAPRDFKGIFINLTRKENNQERQERLRTVSRNMRGVSRETDKETDIELAQLEERDILNREYLTVQETDKLKFLKRAVEIAKMQIAANGTSPELLVPIYDIDGNLLWPKQMGYNDVKKFIKQRHKTDPKI
jgi:hypothetical protein